MSSHIRPPVLSLHVLKDRASAAAEEVGAGVMTLSFSVQAGCMAFSLAKNPEVRAMVKSEIGANLGTATPTFASLKQLPYTFAVLKECLR